jgi:hypothetical protein
MSPTGEGTNTRRVCPQCGVPNGAHLGNCVMLQGKDFALYGEIEQLKERIKVLEDRLSPPTEKASPEGEA